MKATHLIKSGIGILLLALIAACDDEQAAVVTPEAGVISENILTDTLLANIITDPTKADYVVTDLIEVRAKLTVAPGVMLQFEEDAGLHVVEVGTLIANGTAAEKIIFTGTSQTPGFWSGIRTKSDATSYISNAEIHYAGSMQAGQFLQKAALSPEYTTLNLENVLITKSGQFGIQTREDESILEMNNVTFRDNLSSAMYIHPEQIQYIDEVSNFNGGDIEVWAGTTRTSGSDLSWVKPNNGTYFISGDMVIGRAVNIAPGTTFEAEDGVMIEVGGFEDAAIIANGTAAEPIVFTSKTDEAGAWRGILIRSDSDRNVMEHVTVENGGGSEQIAGLMGPVNVGVYSFGKLQMNNSHIANSAGYGVFVKESNSAVFSGTGNTFDNNVLGDLILEE